MTLMILGRNVVVIFNMRYDVNDCVKDMIPRGNRMWFS